MSLFHYTDLNAIVSILQNKKLWLTDLRYLNDKLEFSYGIDQILKSTKRISYGLFSDFSNAPAAAEIVKSKLIEAVRNGADLEPLFVCSLSGAENLLSQWRGYGQYAIEFNEEVFKKNVPSIAKCIYDPETQIRLAERAITDSIQTISKSMNEDGSLRINAKDRLAQLLRLGATFKDEGFSEEMESRIVLSGEGLDINFRVRNNILIPYVEFPISLDMINAIYIGPINERDLSEKSLMKFCSKIQNKWRIESGNEKYTIEVVKSKIPYRSI